MDDGLHNLMIGSVISTQTTFVQHVSISKISVIKKIKVRHSSYEEIVVTKLTKALTFFCYKLEMKKWCTLLVLYFHPLTISLKKIRAAKTSAKSQSNNL